MNIKEKDMTPVELLKEMPQKMSFDILITAFSYEDRILDSLKRSIETFNVNKVVLVSYDGETYLDIPTLTKWRKIRDQMRQLLDTARIPIDEVSCKHDCVRDIPRKLEQSFEQSKKILIDMTGLTKNYILKLAQLSDLPHRKTFFLYTRSSSERFPTVEEMSVAMNKIEPIEGFEGETCIDKTDLVVLMLGYEGNRALAFLHKYETEPFFVMIGSPYAQDETLNYSYIESAEKANRSLLNVHRVLKYEKPVHSLDPFLFLDDLETAIKSFPEIENHNVCLSCLGTKVQTLGLYLYWKRNPETQILYSVPNMRFDNRLGVGNSFIIKLKDDESSVPKEASDIR